MPWTEIRTAATGLGVSCLVTAAISIIGYIVSARRRTLGQGIATWMGNLAVVLVVSLTVPFATIAASGPAGFFDSWTGWVAALVAAGIAVPVNWILAGFVGALGVSGQAVGGILRDDHEPGPEAAKPGADVRFAAGRERSAASAPFAYADPQSESVIAGKWDLAEFKAGAGRVDEAAQMIADLVLGGDAAQRARLESLVESGRVPALAAHPRVQKLLDARGEGASASGDEAS